MQELARIALEGGGSIVFEAPEGSDREAGPAPAGRIGDTVRDLPGTLQSALVPVRDTALAVLEHLKAARPDEVEVQFGVDLSSSAGAVITSAALKANLAVKLVWRRAENEQPLAPSPTAGTPEGPQDAVPAPGAGQEPEAPDRDR